eukprot:3940563-Rhodomonas_salina.5
MPYHTTHIPPTRCAVLSYGMVLGGDAGGTLPEADLSRRRRGIVLCVCYASAYARAMLVSTRVLCYAPTRMLCYVQCSRSVWCYAMCLRARYSMPGSNLAYGLRECYANVTRCSCHTVACYAKSGTEMPYAMSGTDIA